MTPGECNVHEYSRERHGDHVTFVLPIWYYFINVVIIPATGYNSDLNMGERRDRGM